MWRISLYPVQVSKPATRPTTCPSARLVVAADSEVAPAPRSGGGIASPGGCTSNTALTSGPTSSDSMLVSTCRQEQGEPHQPQAVGGAPAAEQRRQARGGSGGGRPGGGGIGLGADDLTRSRSCSSGLAMAAEGSPTAPLSEPKRRSGAKLGGPAALEGN